MQIAVTLKFRSCGFYSCKVKVRTDGDGKRKIRKHLEKTSKKINKTFCSEMFRIMETKNSDTFCSESFPFSSSRDFFVLLSFNRPFSCCARETEEKHSTKTFPEIARLSLKTHVDLLLFYRNLVHEKKNRTEKSRLMRFFHDEKDFFTLLENIFLVVVKSGFLQRIKLEKMGLECTSFSMVCWEKYAEIKNSNNFF
jgi:hypothetical protein